MVKIRAQIKPGSTVSSISNTASVSGQAPTDPAAGNDSSTISTTVGREADLKVTKSGPASAKAGEYVVYSVQVENLGPSNNTAATLTDTLSGELQNATYCVGLACDPSAVGAPSWTGSLAVGGINAGATTVVKIRAQIKPGSTVSSISNTASVSGQAPTDPAAGNDSSTISTTVGREADLKVTKSGPASAKAGEYVVYSVQVENLGPSNNTAATLTDTLSGELQNATYCVGLACDPSAVGAPSWTGSLAVGGINAGATTVVKIRAQIKPGSTVSSISNTASVSGQAPTDPAAGNDSSTISTTVGREADLKVTKSGPASAKAGEYVVYSVQVENLGPSNNTAATLTDTLSGELQNATYCVGLACDPSAVGAPSWTGSLAVGGINAGATTVVKIRAQIKPGSTVSSISNTASVSGQAPTDPAAGNDSSTISTTVGREAELVDHEVGLAGSGVGRQRADLHDHGGLGRAVGRAECVGV